MNNESKNKKIIPLILGIILIGVVSYFLITKVFNKKEEEVIEKEKITPLMYEVTKEGSNNKIYLFGSFHILDLNKIEFPKYLLDAYQNSDYIACEFDIVEFLKNVDQQKLAEEMMYSDGTTLDDHLSKETYDKVVKYMKDTFAYSENITRFLKASQIQSLITTKVLEKMGVIANNGVDTYFLNKAHEDNKKILEVESYELQTEAFDKVSDEYYELAINQILDNMDDAVKEMKKLYDAWKSGDEEALIDLAVNVDNDELTDKEKQIMKEYNQILLDERNIKMTEALEEYFNDNKKVFYMVGAAHLVGPNGIAKQLEKDGYKVVKVN